MRLIDKDALIEEMGEEPLVWNDEADEIAERMQWQIDMSIIEAAPTIEPCEDAISRADAITQIVNTPTLNQNKGQEYLEGSATRQNEIIDILKSLPSVAPSRPSGEWISCSERLPNIGDSGVSDMVLLCWSDGQRTVGAYQGNRTFVGQAWPVARDFRVTVIAWMPLPEPYKESE